MFIEWLDKKYKILVTAFKKNKINNEDILYLIGTGAGLSIGSCLIKF